MKKLVMCLGLGVALMGCDSAEKPTSKDAKKGEVKETKETAKKAGYPCPSLPSGAAEAQLPEGVHFPFSFKIPTGFELKPQTLPQSETLRHTRYVMPFVHTGKKRNGERMLAVEVEVTQLKNQAGQYLPPSGKHTLGQSTQDAQGPGFLGAEAIQVAGQTVQVYRVPGDEAPKYVAGLTHDGKFYEVTVAAKILSTYPLLALDQEGRACLAVTDKLADQVLRSIVWR